MMIDTTREQLATLTEATKLIPPVNGHRPSTTAIWRWCTKGLGPDRIRLEHVRIGRRVCTSQEAINRFLNATAESAAERLSAPPAMPAPKARTRSNRERQRALTEALRDLEHAGLISADTASELANRAA